MLCIGGSQTWSEHPAQGWLIPADSKQLPSKHAFNRLTNQPTARIATVTCHVNSPPALNHPRARNQTARDSPTAQSLPELFKFTSALPCLESSTSPILSPCPTPLLPPVALHGCHASCFSGAVGINFFLCDDQCWVFLSYHS